MRYQDSKIWKRLENLCDDHRELGNIARMCDDAINLSKTIINTFPDYTLHDETHIRNVIYWMEQLLGDSGITTLSVGECAMPLLTACYHDIGMCYTEDQKEKELKSNRFLRYLDDNPKVYLTVKENRDVGKEIPADIQEDYFRKIHPLRAPELLPGKWETNLVRKDKMIAVCRSHGENLKYTETELQYDNFHQTDYLLCAVLLRLADILDFDLSRAPHILYQFQKIATNGNPFADREWRKHQASRGFAFTKERVLGCYAVCENMRQNMISKNFWIMLMKNYPSVVQH